MPRRMCDLELAKRDLRARRNREWAERAAQLGNRAVSETFLASACTDERLIVDACERVGSPDHQASVLDLRPELT
jgi:hypothetical protein